MPRAKPLRPDQKNHVTRVLGQICPDRIYTVEGLMRYAGIGSETLRAARASGMVKAVNIGRRTYYLGRQIVQWIESQAGQTRDANEAAG